MDTEIPLDERLVQELNDLAAEFKRLLEAETSVMEARSTDALPGLVEEKNQIVGSLQEQEPFLINLLNDHAEVDSVQSLKNLLEQCQQLNRQNQTIALVELKHTQNSLELLRTLLKLDDLPLYSAAGDIRVKREKRDLGSA